MIPPPWIAQVKYSDLSSCRATECPGTTRVRHPIYTAKAMQWCIAQLSAIFFLFYKQSMAFPFLALHIKAQLFWGVSFKKEIKRIQWSKICGCQFIYRDLSASTTLSTLYREAETGLVMAQTHLYMPPNDTRHIHNITPPPPPFFSWPTSHFALFKGQEHKSRCVYARLSNLMHPEMIYKTPGDCLVGPENDMSGWSRCILKIHLEDVD